MSTTNALVAAARDGDLRQIKALAKQCDINARDEIGWCALHRAAVHGQVASLRCLVANGADLNAVDDNGETVMHGAAYKHFPDVVELVYEAGADIAVWNQENRQGWTPLDIVEGGIHVGMNILKSAPTAAAIREVMAREGVEPAPQPR